MFILYFEPHVHYYMHPTVSNTVIIIKNKLKNLVTYYKVIHFLSRYLANKKMNILNLTSHHTFLQTGGRA